MAVYCITGTDTGVGKTVATAALAGAARRAGRDVAVCKPVQTGAAPIDGPGDDDLAEVRRLSGVTALHGAWRYPEALAPVAAARRAGLPLPTLDELVDSIREADVPGRLTLVEGAGGLLVEIGAGGATLRDVAAELSAPVVVVVKAGLGTLNHTALTLESLAGQAIPCAGLVIGAWPADAGVAEDDNRVELGRLAPLRAVLPAGAGALSPEEFAATATAAVDPGWLAGL